MNIVERSWKSKNLVILISCFFFLKLVTKQPGLYLFNSYNTFDQKNPKVSVTSDNLPSLGMHVLKGINCETKPSTSIRDSVAHHISLFVGWRVLLDYFSTHPPWIVLHWGGREVYYSYRFECQFFFTTYFSCAKTETACALSVLKGLLGNLTGNNK